MDPGGALACTRLRMYVHPFLRTYDLVGPLRRGGKGKVSYSGPRDVWRGGGAVAQKYKVCLLYTSDAADE